MDAVLITTPRPRAASIGTPYLQNRNTAAARVAARTASPLSTTALQVQRIARYSPHSSHMRFELPIRRDELRIAILTQPARGEALAEQRPRDERSAQPELDCARQRCRVYCSVRFTRGDGPPHSAFMVRTRGPRQRQHVSTRGRLQEVKAYRREMVALRHAVRTQTTRVSWLPVRSAASASTSGAGGGLGRGNEIAEPGSRASGSERRSLLVPYGDQLWRLPTRVSPSASSRAPDAQPSAAVSAQTQNACEHSAQCYVTWRSMQNLGAVGVCGSPSP